MHKINDTHSLTNLQDLIPILADLASYRQHRLEIARVRFVCACMVVTTMLELCLQEQTQIVTNAACRAGIS